MPAVKHPTGAVAQKPGTENPIGFSRENLFELQIVFVRITLEVGILHHHEGCGVLREASAQCRSLVLIPLIPEERDPGPVPDERFQVCPGPVGGRVVQITRSSTGRCARTWRMTVLMLAAPLYAGTTTDRHGGMASLLVTLGSAGMAAIGKQYSGVGSRLAMLFLNPRGEFASGYRVSGSKPSRPVVAIWGRLVGGI